MTPEPTQWSQLDTKGKKNLDRICQKVRKMVGHPITISEGKQNENSLPQHILHYLCAPPTCLRQLMGALGTTLPKPIRRKGDSSTPSATITKAVTSIHRMVVRASLKREIGLRQILFKAYRDMGIRTTYNDTGFLLQTHKFKNLPTGLHQMHILNDSNTRVATCHDCGKEVPDQRDVTCQACHACVDCAHMSICPASGKEARRLLPRALQKLVEKDQRMGRKKRKIPFHTHKEKEKPIGEEGEEEKNTNHLEYKGGKRGKIGEEQKRRK